MKIGVHNIHSGKMLREVLQQKHISHIDLAKKIDRIPLSVTQYTEKKSIQTAVLLEICHATAHNFFSDLADTLPVHFTKNQPNTEAILKEKDAIIAQLQEENQILKIRNEVLLEIQKGK